MRVHNWSQALNYFTVLWAERVPRPVHLVSEHVGVAILTKPTALGFRAEGVVVRPLSDASLCFQTCAIMRKADDSRLTNEFVRSFLRRYADQRRPPKPTELPLSARVVSIEKASPERRH